MRKYIFYLVPLLALPVLALAQQYDIGRSVSQIVDNNLIVGGNTTIGGTLAVTGATTQTGDLALTGGLTVGGTLEVTGATTQTGDLTVTGDVIVNGSDVTVGAAGVKLTGDGDGAITLLGLGNGSDEDLTINLDDTADTIVLSSSTSAATIVGLASYSLGSAGVKLTGDGDGALTILGLGDGFDEDLTINFDDTGNAVTISSSTSVTTISTGTIDFTAADITATGSDLTLNAAGVKLTGDGDGALTILGLGDGFDEDLTFNFDDTGNAVVISSSTSVTTISTGSIDISAGDLYATGSDITLNAAGVKLTGDGDGALTILGLGDGFDEDLTINLDDTGDTVVLSSSTGVTTISTGAIDILTTGSVKAQIRGTSASKQTIAGGNTIAADSCGSVKEVDAAGAVTTDTTNTFTAPAASNAGCCMSVYNSGSETITLDNNGNFLSAGGADVSLTAADVVNVCSNGTVWIQTSALLSLN